MTETAIFIAVGLLVFAVAANIGNDFIMRAADRRRARERAAKAQAAE